MGLVWVCLGLGFNVGVKSWSGLVWGWGSTFGFHCWGFTGPLTVGLVWVSLGLAFNLGVPLLGVHGTLD